MHGAKEVSVCVYAGLLAENARVVLKGQRQQRRTTARPTEARRQRYNDIHTARTPQQSIRHTEPASTLYTTLPSVFVSAPLSLNLYIASHRPPSAHRLAGTYLCMTVLSSSVATLAISPPTTAARINTRSLLALSA